METPSKPAASLRVRARERLEGNPRLHALIQSRWALYAWSKRAWWTLCAIGRRLARVSRSALPDVLCPSRAAVVATTPETRPANMMAWAGTTMFIGSQRWLFQAMASHGHRLRRLRRPTTAAPHPVHVLHVTCSFDLGGTQRQIKNLCEYQHESLFQHDAVEIFPEANFLFRQDVSIDPERYGGQSAVGRTMAKLIGNPDTRSLQSLQVYKLVQDFRALAPDIVVGWGHEVCVLTFLAAALVRVPHIVFCIRTFNPTFGWTSTEWGELLRTAHTQMHPLLSGVITNSTPLRDDYSGWAGISPSRVRVCPNGIEMSTARMDRAAGREAIRRRYDIPLDAVVLCNVGRFSAEKGQMVAMEANRHLLARYGAAAPVWLLCGDGPLLDVVRQFTIDHRMPNVRFADRVDDVENHLAASDVFVMPSDFEGMPNAMMEAMVQSLPSVSTSRSGAVDIARDGIETIYCPPGDPEALATALAPLVESAELRARMGRHAGARIGNFSVTRVIRTFDDCLHAMVAPSAVGTDERNSVQQPAGTGP